MIIVNTKNYKRGSDLLKLVQLIQQYDLKIIVSVPAHDIRYCAGRSPLTIFAQHVDYVGDEKSTGYISAQSTRDAGAFGTLLNHSEHPISYDILKKTIEQCKKMKLTTIVCADSLESARKIAALQPTAIAFEDATLIGTRKSITSAKANDIKKFVTSLKGKPIIPLCGAGISSIEDVRAAYALGCKGVLIASALANTTSVQAVEFLEELKKFESF